MRSNEVVLECPGYGQQWWTVKASLGNTVSPSPSGRIARPRERGTIVGLSIRTNDSVSNRASVILLVLVVIEHRFIEVEFSFAKLN